MKRLSFSLIIILTTFSLKIQAQNKFISKLYPNEITVQYAGNIGLVSAGPTWNYAKNECLSTTLMLGYVPGYLGNKSTVCLSLSKIYTPWHITWKNKMGFEPLTVGVMVSSIFGKDYWLVEPNYYPDNYYGFSTSLRFYLIFGQQFDLIKINNSNKIKKVALYYQFNASELRIIDAFNSKYLKMYDILGLALGIKVHF